MGRVCMAHAEHAEPVPIQIHHMRPRPRGGMESPTIQLCANAHGTVHLMLDEIEARAVASPYATAAEVIRHLPRELWSGCPTLERAIAYRGWLAYGPGFMNGRYDESRRFWRTDGSPRLLEVPHFDDLRHAARWSRKWRNELRGL